MDRRLIFLLALVLLTPIVFGISPEDKAYIDQSNQKVVAQINSKIDSTTTRLETDMQTNFQKEKEGLKEEISREVKGHLKTIALGLAGMIIITMAVFRIVDMKLSHSKNIRKYEKELEKSIADVKLLEQKMVAYKKQLDAYRQQLINQQRVRPQVPVQAPISNQMATNQQPIGAPMPSMDVPTPKKKFELKKFMKTITRIFLVIVILVILGYIILQFVPIKIGN